MKLDFSFRRYFKDKHSKYEKDMSPGTSFKDVPDEAETIAVIMEDMDADGEGTFINWLIWNIPASENLEEGIPREKKLESGAVQGNNDYDEIGYGGPKPLRGSRHEYRIRAYALDTELNLEPGARISELEEAMHEHVLDKAERTIPYSRDYDESDELRL